MNTYEHTNKIKYNKNISKEISSKNLSESKKQ